MSRSMGAIEDRYDAPELLMPDRAAELANDPCPYIRGDRFREEADSTRQNTDRANSRPSRYHGVDRRTGARAETRTCEWSIHTMRAVIGEVRDAGESGRRRRSSRIAQHHGYGTTDMVTT